MLSVLSNQPHRSFVVFEEELSRVKSQALFFFAKLPHAKPEHASCELSREPREMRVSLMVITRLGFAIALEEIRTRRILREKADCKQSNQARLGTPKTKKAVRNARGLIPTTLRKNRGLSNIEVERIRER